MCTSADESEVQHPLQLLLDNGLLQIPSLVQKWGCVWSFPQWSVFFLRFSPSVPYTFICSSLKTLIPLEGSLARTQPPDLWWPQVRNLPRDFSSLRVSGVNVCSLCLSHGFIWVLDGSSPENEQYSSILKAHHQKLDYKEPCTGLASRLIHPAPSPRAVLWV